MLAQTVVMIALLAIFAASAVSGIAGVARAQSAGAAKALIVPGVETALGAYQRYLAAAIGAQIAAGGDVAIAPPVAIPALSGGTAWSSQHYLEAASGEPGLQIAVDVVPTAQSVPVCTGAGSGPDAAIALQCSAFVQESRLSLALTSDAGPADAGGTINPLAHGRYTVTVRLFAEPPYAIVSGVKDAEDPAGFHEGDGAGYGNALGAFASPAPDDTTIHVVFACTPGSGSCATSNPPPQDDPMTVPWSNGNGLP